MTVRTKVAGATNRYSPWPRENLLRDYDLQAWSTAGCSFIMDPANQNDPPSSGLLEILDARPGSARSIIQPTGFAPIVANEGRGYLGGNRTLNMSALASIGASDGSQAPLYQYMRSSTGVLPTTANVEYEIWMAVHPFTPLITVASDGSNTASGGFTIRVVNGQVIFTPAAFTSVVATPGATGALVNRSLLIHVRRLAGSSLVEVWPEGGTGYTSTTGAAVTNGLPSSSFSIGKRFNLYSGSDHNGYGEFGCAIVNIGDVGATIRAQQRAFMEVRHGFR